MAFQVTASSHEAAQRMRRVRQRNTGPEMALRRELHRRGLRYLVDQRVVGALGTQRPDLIFTGARVAVFVDGCFWHSCPMHGSMPSANRGWWEEKLAGNRSRDQASDSRLRDAGWGVIRIWEHEDPRTAADRIVELVSQRRHVRMRVPTTDRIRPSTNVNGRTAMVSASGLTSDS